MNDHTTTGTDLQVPVMTGKQRENARFAYVLGITQRHIYEGTVPRAQKQRRRARNRAARRARATQRARS